MGIELAPLTGAYDLVGISDRDGPVKALAECVAHEGTWHCVVVTHTRVDVSDELATLGVGMHCCRMPNAARLVQLAVDDSKRLGHPGDAYDLGPIWGKFPVTTRPGKYRTIA
jgi:hypothetical protein